MLGITGLFTGNLPGHVMVRRLFLLFTFTLIVINFITIQAIKQGSLEYQFGIAISGLFSIVVFLLLIGITARELNHVEIKKQIAENGLQRLNAELEVKIAQRSLQLNDANEELHQQNQVLESQNILLENANTELTSFTHIASHDLKEPLRKINMFISAIETENIQQLSSRNQQNFQRIADTANRMGILIDDLLSFSSVNTSNNAFNIIDLNEILKSVEEDLKEYISEKHLIIQSSHLPVIYGVSFQLHQLFTNLITNAIKYSKQDIPPYLKITNDLVQETSLTKEFPTAKGTYHQITFEDNGIGFSTEYRHKIFEIFQRLHTKNTYPGTGIGLAICKKVMDNHKGFIIADSQPEVGSTFTIYLPERV
jgi:light-regulated signal transduction histidine kinase (bacteriophytochrome)